MPESNGQLGVRFTLTPNTVEQPPTGARRSGFSVRGAEPYPGTSGGVGLLMQTIFRSCADCSPQLRHGRGSVPLTVTYRGGVLAHGEEALRTVRAVFSMELKRTSRMLYGTFDIINGDGSRLYAGRATSGLAGYQYSGAFWTVGKGVIPPTANSSRFILTRVYATDPPMGTRYQITPEMVWNDAHTISRTAFRVHFDTNQPGSAGCIVTPAPSDYDKIVALFAALTSRGVDKIPLTLNYT